MGKIHTHYDNLKVSRMAPQEVIRAAYKALSQKYHPDKNPGDEKAARIMAILNSAYGTLSDAQRRKEHDEWIAAEEWEIAWLESTRNEDGTRDLHDKHRHDAPQQAWPAHADEPRVVRRRRRDWLWWGGLAGCLLLGWSGGMLMVAEPQLMSTMLTSAWGSHGDLAQADGRRAKADGGPGGENKKSKADADAFDSWAVGKPSLADNGQLKPPPVKVQALSQVVLPGMAVDCDSEEQTLVAPNGEPWPAKSGYVEGFPVASHGDDVQIAVDNSSNPSAVFIKVYDMERHVNVRYVFIQAHDKMVVDKLLSGRYEIRYQNIDMAGDRAGCPQRRSSSASGQITAG
jgi:hypothetical protein